MPISNVMTAPGHAFCPTGDAHLQRSLFNVCPDIPIADVPGKRVRAPGHPAGSLLCTAMGERIITSDDAFLMAHTLKSAKTVVDALMGGLEP